MSDPTPFESLPHDVLRRVVDTVETSGMGHMSAVRTPLKTALVLSQVSRRLRAYVISSYLPSITSITHREFQPLISAGGTGGAAALEALLGRCTGLKQFSSAGAASGLVTSTAVEAMANAAHETLEEVDIKYIDVKDAAVKPLFSCPKLKRLEMSYGRDVTFDLFNLPPGQTIIAPLEYLDLTWVACVNKTAIEHIAGISTLRFLFLKNCEFVDNNAASILVKGPAAKSLETLSICYCPINDAMVKKILESMPKLRKLLVAERVGVHFIEGAYTIDGIEDARTEFPEVKIEFDT